MPLPAEVPPPAAGARAPERVFAPLLRLLLIHTRPTAVRQLWTFSSVDSSAGHRTAADASPSDGTWGASSGPRASRSGVVVRRMSAWVELGTAEPISQMFHNAFFWAPAPKKRGEHDRARTDVVFSSNFRSLMDLSTCPRVPGERDNPGGAPGSSIAAMFRGRSWKRSRRAPRRAASAALRRQGTPRSVVGFCAGRQIARTANSASLFAIRARPCSRAVNAWTQLEEQLSKNASPFCMQPEGASGTVRTLPRWAGTAVNCMPTETASHEMPWLSLPSSFVMSAA